MTLFTEIDLAAVVVVATFDVLAVSKEGNESVNVPLPFHQGDTEVGISAILGVGKVSYNITGKLPDVEEVVQSLWASVPDEAKSEDIRYALLRLDPLNSYNSQDMVFPYLLDAPLKLSFRKMQVCLTAPKAPEEEGEACSIEVIVSKSELSHPSVAVVLKYAFQMIQALEVPVSTQMPRSQIGFEDMDDDIPF